MSSLTWKLNRLRVMGVAEVSHRLATALGQRLQAAGLGLARTPPPPRLARFGKGWVPLLPSNRAPWIAAAERVLAGKFDVFAEQAVQLGFPPQWNRDPRTGKQVPLSFGKLLDYRDEALVGDIKCLWEPNRHGGLSDLAMAYAISADVRYADGVRILLESWFEQCPYPLGANWSSALEVAIRLISWHYTWHLLGGTESPLFAGEEGRRFRDRWLASVYQHCHFVAGHLSRHSSANNHLFGELTGLHVAASTWPCWPESERWARQSRAELETEALRQNHADGVNREQAIYYQFSVADEMLLNVMVAAANGQPFPPPFLDRLEKMIEFVAAMSNVTGDVPMIGDADDALLACWDREPGFNPYRSLLAAGAVIFRRADFKRKAGRFDAKSAWLLGPEGKAAWEALDTAQAPVEPSRQFPEGGYTIFGRALGQSDEVRIVADAGPLGYLGIAAHGHADALSFTLSIGGAMVLVDPGTYAYHTHKKWRDYFRGTSAHNTVRIDGMDQSESGGNFLWLRKAQARCEAWQPGPDRDHWAGSHDGYTWLADPLTHRRMLDFDKLSAVLVVEDVLECRGEHDVEWFWHIDPRWAVAVVAGGVECRLGTQVIRIAMEGADPPSLLRASDEPPGGWIAWRFEEKVAATTVVWRERIRGITRRRTTFDLSGGLVP
jgi:hypothetical protein